MKKNKLLLISLVTVNFLLIGQLIVKAQTKRLSESDKTQIIQAILKQENFKKSGSRDKDKAANTIYILNENVTAASPD